MVVRTHVESQRGENQTWEARWWSSISSCPFITRRKPKEWNVYRTIHHQNQTWLLSVWTSDRKCGKKKDFWRAVPKLSGVKRCIHFLWPFPSLMPPTCYAHFLALCLDSLSLYIYTVYGSNNSSVTDVCLFDYQLSMSGGEMMGMILETLPVGFRFYPTDQLLVDHFLSLKIRGMDKIVDDDS